MRKTIHHTAFTSAGPPPNPHGADTMLPRETQITVPASPAGLTALKPSSVLTTGQHLAFFLTAALIPSYREPASLAHCPANVETWRCCSSENDASLAIHPSELPLKNHFPDSQKCGSSGHPYRKWRWEVERTLILYRNSTKYALSVRSQHHTMVLFTSKLCGQQVFPHNRPHVNSHSLVGHSGASISP